MDFVPLARIVMAVGAVVIILLPAGLYSYRRKRKARAH